MFFCFYFPQKTKIELKLFFFILLSAPLIWFVVVLINRNLNLSRYRKYQNFGSSFGFWFHFEPKTKAWTKPKLIPKPKFRLHNAQINVNVKTVPAIEDKHSLCNIFHSFATSVWFLANVYYQMRDYSPDNQSH